MYGYAYRYSARPNVLAFNPLTDIDGLSLYLNKNTNVNSKLGVSLDGSTDALNIDSVLTPLASTTTGEWECYYTPVDATPLAVGTIIGFGDTNATEYIDFRIQTSGVLRAQCVLGGVGQWTIDTDSSAFSDGVSTKISLKHNGTEPTLYVDDIAVAQTITVSTDTTAWFNDLTGLDNARIGCINTASLGNIQFIEGTIQDVKIWSDDTQSTLVASYLFNDANDIGKDYTNSYDATLIGTPISVIGTQTEPTEPLDEVFSWVDQSVNGFIFSQSTVTKQPQLANDGNSIDFDGTDDGLTKTIADALNDTSGIIFFSGYFDNSANNFIFSTADQSVDTKYWVVEIQGATGKLRINCSDGTTANVITSTNVITNGSYFYGYMKSNGTAYEINLNGNIETLIVVTGSNDGMFIGDVSGRDSLTVGWLDRLSPIYTPVKANKLIYSNDHTIDTDKIMDFMSNPDN